MIEHAGWITDPDIIIEHGDRIAQAVVVPVVHALNEYVNSSRILIEVRVVLEVQVSDMTIYLPMWIFWLLTVIGTLIGLYIITSYRNVHLGRSKNDPSF